jgi:hypothetical protein
MVRRELSLACAYGFADCAVRAMQRKAPEDCLEDFLEPGSQAFIQRVSKPQKDTLLHMFIRNLNTLDFQYMLRKFTGDTVDESARLLEAAGMEVPDWLTPERVRRHTSQAERLVEQATKIVADSAFHLLFGDREFLWRFQELVSCQVSRLGMEKAEQSLVAPGVLRRPANLPSWLTRAVFYRDKGICQQCYRDLTGTINLETIENFDHIVPLSRSGSNDPTNFQLLCASCNHSKSSTQGEPSRVTFAYW